MTYYDIDTGEEISDDQLHDRYDEMLDELGDVEVGGLSYPHSLALKRIDEVAYRCGFSDWAGEDGAGVAEFGYWVRVATEDGDDVEGPFWYTDEDDARQAGADFAAGGCDDLPAGIYIVSVYTTGDDGIAEHRVIVH